MEPITRDVRKATRKLLTRGTVKFGANAPEMPPRRQAENALMSMPPLPASLRGEVR
jgi:hypothetical protein